MKVPRALLLRYHSLGDVVLTTGIVRALHERGFRVDVVTEDPFRTIFAGSPHLSRLFSRDEWEARSVDPDRNADSAAMPAPAEPNPEYERVIDLQGSPSSRRATRGRKARRVVNTRSVARRWVVLWGDRKPHPSIPHAVARYAEAALGGLGAELPEPAELRPEVHVTDDDRAALAAECPEVGLEAERPRVALLTGASRVSKAYPAEKFAVVGREFERRGWEVLWVEAPPPASGSAPGRSGTSDQRGRSVGAGLPGRAGPPVGRRVAVSLGALKAVLNSVQLAVSGDSGPMHLATALDLPVVAVFGSSVRTFGFTPVGRRTRVLEVQGLRCRPCGVHGRDRCWRGGFPCLQTDPEEVVRTGLELLEERTTGEPTDGSGVPGSDPSSTALRQKLGTTER